MQGKGLVPLELSPAVEGGVLLQAQIGTHPESIPRLIELLDHHDDNVLISVTDCLGVLALT